MSLEFSDNDNGINATLNLGESVTKKFIITNTGTLEASLSLDFYKLYNTYMDGSLTYRLEYSDVEDGEYTELIPETNLPVTDSEINYPISTEISVPSTGIKNEDYKRYYNLIITFNNTDVDQTSDMNATFYTYFNVKEPIQYRLYDLSIDPNGGVYEEHTGIYKLNSLKHNETQNIIEPTRVGYTFSGWEVTGVSSSIEDATFHMGISDTTLKAKWTPNVYNLTVDLDGGSITNEIKSKISYGESIELENPTKEGYTFLNWEVPNESMLQV